MSERRFYCPMQGKPVVLELGACPTCKHATFHLEVAPGFCGSYTPHEGRNHGHLCTLFEGHAGEHSSYFVTGCTTLDWRTA